MFRPGTALTFRKLRVLLTYLQPDSNFKTAMRDELSDEQLAELAKQPRKGHGAWSHTDMLLAAIFDQLSVQQSITLAAAGVKNPPKPQLLPRPGVAEKQATGLSPEVLAELQYRREHRGAAPPE